MKLYDAQDIVDLIIIYLFQIASQLFNDDIRTGYLYYVQVIYYIFHIEAVYEIYQTFSWHQSLTLVNIIILK